MSTYIVLGGLDLMAAPFSVDASDFSLGAPAPVNVESPSALDDGALVRTERNENREVSLRVWFDGQDFADLSRLESLLTLEAGKRSTLTMGGFAPEQPPTVFDVETSDLTPIPSDEDEMFRVRRTFMLRLVCRPWARSATKVTTDITLGGGTAQVIDNGDSATAWSQPYASSTAPTAQTSVFHSAPGALQFVVPRGQSGFYLLRGTRAGSFDLTGKGIIRLAVNAPANGAIVTSTATLYAVVGGSRVTIAQGCTAISSTTDFTVLEFVLLNAGKAQVSAFEVSIPVQLQGVPADAYPATIVARLDTMQAFASSGAPGRQFSFSPMVRGSVRTPATIRLRHSTTNLGDTLVYTYRDTGSGYAPPLSTYRTATQTADNGAVITGFVGGSWRPPLRTLEPGLYAVMVRANVTSSGTFPVTVAADGVVVSRKSVSTATSGWQNLDVGVAFLPQRRAHPSSTGTVLISITGAGNIDEAWLYRLEDADLTWVDVPARQLWLNAPSPSEPFGAIWRGNTDDFSDATHPGDGLKRFSRHQFLPTGTGVHVVTVGTAGVAGSLEYFPVGHTHAPE